MAARRYATMAVLVAGVILRIALAVVTPPQCAFDDHLEPLKVILVKGEIPSAADCWECYQPPLYYAVSAGFYGLVRAVAGPAADGADLKETLARRVLQGVSVVAGCATLCVCQLVFRRFKALTDHEALVLAAIAFLPCHIYMSAMATNDALTYLLATLAIYAALRAEAAGWSTRACLLTGLLAGATVLSKGYGWVTLAAIAGSVWWFTRQPGTTPESRVRRELRRPLLLVLAVAMPLAFWPNVRNAWTYGEPLIDNFKFWSETPLRYQPPGSLAQTSFASFRFASLLRHPYLHASQADSFWTQLYARLWFDHEAFHSTLPRYAPWQRLWERCAQQYPEWNRARWEALLSYAPDEVPPNFSMLARISYLAGLPLTLAVVAGLVLALRRMRNDFALTLVTAHFLLALAVPLVQTLRLPHFAAMKASFALSGLSSAPILLAVLLGAIPTRSIRALAQVGAWLVSLVIIGADVAYVILYAAQG